MRPLLLITQPQLMMISKNEQMSGAIIVNFTHRAYITEFVPLLGRIPGTGTIRLTTP